MTLRDVPGDRPSPEEFFAAEGGARNVCKVCIHPDREEIDRGLRNGVVNAAMERWINQLTEHPVVKGAVYNHVSKGHHLSG